MIAQINQDVFHTKKPLLSANQASIAETVNNCALLWCSPIFAVQTCLGFLQKHDY
jgi:hypothetical protein